MAASWSRDGQSIYFSSNKEGSWDVWQHIIATEQVTPLNLKHGFGAIESMDGKGLFFSRHNAVGLWYKPHGGQEQLVLPNLDPRDWGSWSITNLGIYFVSRGQPTVVAFHDLASGVTDTLFTPAHGIPGMDPALAVSPTGAILFGQHERSESDLMYIDNFR